MFILGISEAHSLYLQNLIMVTYLQFFASVFRFEMISRSGLDHKINLGLDPESAIALDADPDSVKYLDPDSVNLDPKHYLSP